MDTSRLPAYRSSYLLRFHPYPRSKPSARERIAFATQEDGYYEQPQVDSLHVLETDVSTTLNQAINGSDVHTHARRLSVSSLIVDLALLLKKASLEDK